MNLRRQILSWTDECMYVGIRFFACSASSSFIYIFGLLNFCPWCGRSLLIFSRSYSRRFVDENAKRFAKIGNSLVGFDKLPQLCTSTRSTHRFRFNSELRNQKTKVKSICEFYCKIKITEKCLSSYFKPSQQSVGYKLVQISRYHRFMTSCVRDKNRKVRAFCRFLRSTNLSRKNLFRVRRAVPLHMKINQRQKEKPKAKFNN